MSNNKSSHQQKTWALNKRPASGASNKNQRLTNDAYLQIYGWGQLPEVIMSCFFKCWHFECALHITSICTKQKYVNQKICSTINMQHKDISHSLWTMIYIVKTLLITVFLSENCLVNNQAPINLSQVYIRQEPKIMIVYVKADYIC